MFDLVPAMVPSSVLADPVAAFAAEEASVADQEVVDYSGTEAASTAVEVVHRQDIVVAAAVAFVAVLLVATGHS